jgi:hypothetical protein
MLSNADADRAGSVAMTMAATTIELLHREIANPDTQWSLGTFGAIAEFSRNPDVTLLQADDVVSADPSRPKASARPAGASESRFACRTTIAR